MAAAEESKVTSGGGGTNKIFLVMFLINMLATLALGYFLMEAKMEISKQKEEAQKAVPKTKGDAGVSVKESEEEKEYAPGPMVDLGALVVNIEGLDGRLYLLRTTLHIELDNEDARRETETKVVQLRYHLSQILASRKREELVGPEQMESLRKLMIRHANAVLASKKGKVLNIWPHDWLVE